MFTWYQETCFTTAAAPFSSARSNKDPTRTNLKKQIQGFSSSTIKHLVVLGDLYSLLNPFPMKHD